MALRWRLESPLSAAGAIALLFALLLGVGCGTSGPLFWALPEGASEVLVLVEGKGGVRLETILHRVDASTSWSFTPEPGDQQLTMIGLSEAELNALAPGRDPARELSASVNTPPAGRRLNATAKGLIASLAKRRQRSLARGIVSARPSK